MRDFGAEIMSARQFIRMTDSDLPSWSMSKWANVLSVRLGSVALEVETLAIDAGTDQGEDKELLRARLVALAAVTCEALEATYREDKSK